MPFRYRKIFKASCIMGLASCAKALISVSDFAPDAKRATLDGLVYFYPIEPLGRLHGFDNERVKIAIKRVKLAVGRAKLLK